MAGKRLLIMSLHYPPEPAGNAPYVGALAAGLFERGYAVAAYVAHPHYPDWKIWPTYGQWRRREILDGVAVERLLHYVPRPPRGIRRLVSELSFGLRLLTARLPRDGTAIVVSPALFASALGVLRIRLARKRWPVVVWVQDIYTLGLVETQEGGGFSTRITKAVERLVMRSADRVVVIHPRFGEYAVTQFGVDPSRIRVIRNWTHLDPPPRVTPAEARAALGWPCDMTLVVHTGNMGAKQGLENVIKAARLADQRCIPLMFVLVGDGSERAKLMQLGDGIQRLMFVDPLNDRDYRYALAAADCLLVNERPGVAAMSVPSKLTSYFNASRPVLAATDPKGITASEVERAGAGVVVSAGSPEELLATALELTGDRARCSTYGEAGYRFSQEYLSAGAAIDGFERVIEELGA